MSIPILNQVYDEMRRLAIAGSTVASGDFRLKKLAPPLEQAGAKAPVFQKVAKAVEGVVGSDEKNSAEKLLELCSLVNAILYTQGQTDVAGEITEIPSTEIALQTTNVNARTLKPLLEALTSSGSGRMEVVKDAYERGLFNDLRLVKPALQAMNDRYGEVADFVGENVLPKYGTAIYPLLKADYKSDGKMGDARRLALMFFLDPTETRAAVMDALENGSKDVKIVAIGCLGQEPEDLPFLLDQLKSKSKETRAAVYKSLANMDHPEAAAALERVISDDDLALVTPFLQKGKSQQLLDKVLAECDITFGQLLQTKDKKLAGPLAARSQLLYKCLVERNDKKTESLVLAHFSRSDQLIKIEGEPSGRDVFEHIVRVMTLGTEQMRDTFIAAHESLDTRLLGVAFVSACRGWDSAKVFDKFSEYISPKGGFLKRKKTIPLEKYEKIKTSILTGCRLWDYDSLANHYSYYEYHNEQSPVWDRRWLNAAIEVEDIELICKLANKEDNKAAKIIVDRFEKEISSFKKLDLITELVSTLLRIEHPHGLQAAIGVFTKLNKKTFDWQTQQAIRKMGHALLHLPQTAIATLEENIASWNENLVDLLVERITDLKQQYSGVT